MAVNIQIHQNLKRMLSFTLKKTIDSLKEKLLSENYRYKIHYIKKT